MYIDHSGRLRGSSLGYKIRENEDWSVYRQTQGIITVFST
jgi:hypothetical protein